MQTKARYSIDTSALIHAWRRAYPPKNFESFWTRLEKLIEDEVILASIEVINELKKKDDDIHQWCNGQPEWFSKDIDDNLQGHLSHIMGTYPRLVDTVKGRSGGDPFVIALARANLPRPLTVITQETPGKKASPKIPDVCKDEKIPCMNLVEFIQAEDWRF